MTIKRITPDDIESFSLLLQPKVTYSSSSLGVTGSRKLLRQASSIEKDVTKPLAFQDSLFDDVSVEQIRNNLIHATGTNIAAGVQEYISAVHNKSTAPKNLQEINILRFTPSTTFTRESQKKNIIRNVLFPFYRSSSPSYQWSYPNYHSLNFFTSDSTPSDSVLLFPSSASLGTTTASGTYMLSNAFTFEFYINPRYTVNSGEDFKAGTILHLSSTYAISLITGSGKDESDRPNTFSLLLQLSGAADIAPSLATEATSLTFISDDVLLLNHWHHVAIRWSSNINAGTGSFVINGNVNQSFHIPHPSIAPAAFTVTENPDVLCVGNYYEGSNVGITAVSRFFNQVIAIREGLPQLIDDGDNSSSGPELYEFRHPLNAEIHDIRIYDRYRSTTQIDSDRAKGPADVVGMKFYLPPYFTKESPITQPYGFDADGNLQGGVLQTPFFSISGSTGTPFNTALSFGVAGRLSNLQNYTRDLVTGNHARLLNLSASLLNEQQTPLSANSILYATASIRKRNLTILPNDNGLFSPDFSILNNLGLDTTTFKNELSNNDISRISLADMVPTSSIVFAITDTTSSISYGILGASPEDMSLAPGATFTILNRTRDASSNEVVFFDISNMFYGMSIMPKSVYLTDKSLTGSAGKVSITLHDNGMGGLYRADALTPHAMWNDVGNVLYNEGLIVVKTPELPFFGKDQWEISFNGQQNIHMLRFNIIAHPGEIDDSVNNAYLPVSASLLANDNDTDFVYITGINFHDDNLNVIMKTKLAQPMIKRRSDRIAFRPKIDF